MWIKTKIARCRISHFSFLAVKEKTLYVEYLSSVFLEADWNKPPLQHLSGRTKWNIPTFPTVNREEQMGNMKQKHEQVTWHLALDFWPLNRSNKALRIKCKRWHRRQTDNRRTSQLRDWIGPLGRITTSVWKGYMKYSYISNSKKEEQICNT